MKRRVLMAWLKRHNCIVEREGKAHTQVYCRGKNASVPRHKEINTFTARGICRDLGIPVIETK
jgi:hypothetical protein